MAIEVEVRSFITKEKYDKLLKFFKRNAEFVNEDYQETYYFDSDADLRIQRNNFFSKIWLKKGKIHDDFREEIEIKFKRNDFENLEKLFFNLGFNVEIKWFRKRYHFKWERIDVMLDYTNGYGYIIELEKMSQGGDKEEILNMLNKKLISINVNPTSKEEFDKKYEHYKKNWRKLVENE